MSHNVWHPEQQREKDKRLTQSLRRHVMAPWMSVASVMASVLKESAKLKKFGHESSSPSLAPIGRGPLLQQFGC